jgi:hypothetical protein
VKGLDLEGLVRRCVGLAFVLAGGLVRRCTFYKTKSGPATGLVGGCVAYGTVNALFVDYRSQDIDGSSVVVGDEKAFVRGAELAGVYPPGPGDFLTESVSGLRRLVVAARLDPTGAVWVMQVRRTAAEDWGGLSLGGVSREDWGVLELAAVFEDLDTWGG